MTDIYIQADRIIDELEREAVKLPQKQVWWCKTKEEVVNLIDRLNQAIDSYYQVMSGTLEPTRKMLAEMIEITEEEIKEAESVLFSLRRI